MLSLLALGMLAGRVAASDAVKLEYKFAPGELMRYRIHKSSSSEIIDPSGTEPRVVDGILRLRISKILANGDAEIRAAYESGTCSAIGDTVSISADRVAPVTFQVSRTGVIRNEKTAFDRAGEVITTRDNEDGGRETVKCNVYKETVPVLFKELPTHDVKVGDTWDIGSPEKEGPAGIVTHSKLTSIDTQVKGMPTAVILTTADFKDNPIIADTQYDVHITLDGKWAFSVEKGHVTQLDEEFKVMTSPSSSDGQTTTTTISSQATLLAEVKTK
jgi:hypothetical protein